MLKYLMVLACVVLLVFPVFGQALLSNPSFEVAGDGGNLFGGWSQFGNIESDTLASHGNVSARLRGETSGDWNVSGLWQRMDCSSGEEFEISCMAINSDSNPLTGTSRAIVNIEWYDNNNQMIDYESFTVIEEGSSTEEFTSFQELSSPAPSNVSYIHFLIGLLQNSNDPIGEMIFDQITLFSTEYPTIDDVQWVDFPDGRILEFADMLWRVKGTGWYGPGPNHFSHTEECVWVDDEEQLHLTIKNIDDVWYSTEVVLEDVLGYGDYIFTTEGALNLLDPHTVLGIFIWQYAVSYDGSNEWWNPYNEIDVEYSRWGNPANEIGQFVAQPWFWEGNIERYDAVFEAGQLSSHAFNWLPDRVEFRSWYGSAEDESIENMIYEWTYTGPHIPRPEQPRVHLNLWQTGGNPATEQEVVIDDFTFIPYNGGINEAPVLSFPESFSFFYGNFLLIDLDDYCFDTDPLEYSIEGLTQLEYTIYNSMLTIWSGELWTGSETALISVSDGINSPVSAEIEIVCLPIDEFLGDVDANEIIDAYDAAIVLQYVAGIDPGSVAPLPWESWRLDRADVDENDVIDAYDSALILQHVCGIIEEFRY